LSDQVKRLLDKLAAQICLDITHIKTIVITGHADSSPQDNFKRKLSLERAVAVADYLKSQCPALTYDKLVIKGKADRKPVADNNTEIGRALNRRVEIQIKR
jgi:outer membrane protein OmpA-like peptidoglycan-associated protein